MEENKIVYVCDRRKCEYCSVECTHTTDIEHAKNFHKEGNTFFEDDTLNKKVKNQAKEIRSLLKRIDWLENHHNFKKPPKETRVLEDKIKNLVDNNNQLKTLLAHFLLKAYDDKPQLLSNDLKEMVRKYAEDTEIERLLKG